MTDTTNFRMERIEKLLRELEYEVTRGMLEKDIGEEIDFEFFVPISSKIPNGVVACRFQTRPIPRIGMPFNALQPRLKLVKS